MHCSQAGKSPEVLSERRPVPQELAGRRLPIPCAFPLQEDRTFAPLPPAAVLPELLLFDRPSRTARSKSSATRLSDDARVILLARDSQPGIRTLGESVRVERQSSAMPQVATGRELAPRRSATCRRQLSPPSPRCTGLRSERSRLRATCAGPEAPPYFAPCSGSVCAALGGSLVELLESLDYPVAYVPVSIQHDRLPGISLVNKKLLFQRSTNLYWAEAGAISLRSDCSLRPIGGEGGPPSPRTLDAFITQLWQSVNHFPHLAL